MTDLDMVRAVADAVLYEGYLLYPYRASSRKNRSRFQFGVLMPPDYPDPSEPSGLRAECLLEGRDGARVGLVLRFLRLRRRPADESAAAGHWDEAEDVEITNSATVADLLAGEVALPFELAAGERTEDGQGWRTGAVHGVLTAEAQRLPGPFGAVRLRVGVRNTGEVGGTGDREHALPHALVSAHVVVSLDGGSFVSMVEPPEWAAPDVAGCVNEGVWPVLVGPGDRTDVMLCSPIILYDHPEIAPESDGDLFDATEIDEILTLRTMALTDDEKAEARATDPKAAALIDRVDAMSPDALDRLHGTIRYRRPVADEVPTLPEPDAPWWDPGADASVSPETDEVLVAGVAVRRGSMVWMRPGMRRADAQDFLFAGRLAEVQAVLHDVDGQVHVAVSPADDPDADIQRGHGRFLYFAPDELEPAGQEREGP
jgi:hypothetical protein